MTKPVRQRCRVFCFSPDILFRFHLTSSSAAMLLRSLHRDLLYMASEVANTSTALQAFRQQKPSDFAEPISECDPYTAHYLIIFQADNGCIYSPCSSTRTVPVFQTRWTPGRESQSQGPLRSQGRARCSHVQVWPFRALKIPLNSTYTCSWEAAKPAESRFAKTALA